MKKTFLFLFMTFMMSWSGLKAQGLDYIIMLDNGSSITADEYANMRRGAIKLMEELLACNNKSRVAVVQYGTGKYGDTSGTYKPMIYIESDFTSDQFVAQNFERRLDFGDLFNESLGMIGDALDGNPNANIVSPQTTLGLVSDLRVVVFTDAMRNLGNALTGTYLVNSGSPGYGTTAAFLNELKFKYNRGARFTMIHTSPVMSAIRAGAAIASYGAGSYSGPVEPVQGDPNINVTPRLYFNRPNGFQVFPGEMEYWRDLAQNICETNGMGTVDFRYEPGECIGYTQGVGGYHHLPAGATLLNLKLELVGLQSGTVFPVPYNPSFGPGNYFVYYPLPSDFDAAVNGGATGIQKFKLTMEYSYNGQTEVAYAWNNYPFFDYDINMDCPVLKTAKPSEEKMFKLTPNPTDGLFKVILNKEVKSGKLEIRDLTGNAVYNKILRNEKEIDIDISSRKEGVYIVNAINDKNEIYSEKIIKK
ncbi:Por secretion system C-terminal sorting domain-containing protein [Chryseobacterium oleae]|uniref:Por secretion system C-terminal sorting domain-containing protein n=1 Tax=Chryseobacterium oleae TaxID=491207 RepID=A0A1I4XNQ0_CHROL|nr:T9SS type A sorting domain-containing protein [Chryseobacterium oleae]SFN27518.1 Por secretion system C-terminal sorting domain-containing protein [Chryseobacterium oleae]